jgi:hypothetical protein
MPPSTMPAMAPGDIGAAFVVVVVLLTVLLVIEVVIAVAVLPGRNERSVWDEDVVVSLPAVEDGVATVGVGVDGAGVSTGEVVGGSVYT